MSLSLSSIFTRSKREPMQKHTKNNWIGEQTLLAGMEDVSKTMVLWCCVCMWVSFGCGPRARNTPPHQETVFPPSALLQCNGTPTAHQSNKRKVILLTSVRAISRIVHVDHHSQRLLTANTLTPKTQRGRATMVQHNIQNTTPCTEGSDLGPYAF